MSDHFGTLCIKGLMVYVIAGTQKDHGETSFVSIPLDDLVDSVEVEIIVQWQLKKINSFVVWWWY